MRRLTKITLIEPEAAGFHVFTQFKMPRLGLPLLGTILSQSGFEVNIHVGALSKKDIVLFGRSDLIGISTTTSTAPEAYRLADIFRRMGKTVVLGGVHATFVAGEALKHADYVVRGEAEDTFPELVSRLDAGESPDDIAGLSFYKGEEVVHNPIQCLVDDLDRLPFPDFRLLGAQQKLFNAPVQTSRGCPYPCNFCNVTQMFGRKVRFRSIDHVLDEMAQLPKDTIFFYDDNFCSNPAYTKKLCEGILQRGLKPRYSSAQVRADVTRDPELIELLAKSGTDVVYVGFESINPQTLKAYDKRQSIEEIANAMDVFHRYKIRVHGMFVIGSDYDSIQTAEETRRFAERQRMDTVQFMMLTPIPGTELYRQLCEQVRIVATDWSLYDGQHAVFLPKMMSPEQLQRSAMMAMSRFYSLREGLRHLARKDLYTASRRFLGWYIIKRWRWDNRAWPSTLRAQTLKVHRAKLERQLQELGSQLDELLKPLRGQLPVVTSKLEELRRTGESYLKEISRISKELKSALGDDIEKIERRTKELAAMVRKALEEVKAYYEPPRPDAVKT